MGRSRVPGPPHKTKPLTSHNWESPLQKRHTMGKLEEAVFAGHYFFFSAALASPSGFSSSFFSSASISSMGFGGGVVAIVQPIHAPMPNTATKAIRTGVATSQYRTSSPPKSI